MFLSAGEYIYIRMWPRQPPDNRTSSSLPLAQLVIVLVLMRIYLGWSVEVVLYYTLLLTSNE